MQLTSMDLSYIPLLALVVVLVGYIVLITYKNYAQISGEHMGLILMAWIVAKSLQISATLIVIYWRMALFEAALLVASDYSATGFVMAIGDIFIAIILVYTAMFVPETFLKIMISRHKTRDRQASSGRKLMSSIYI